MLAQQANASNPEARVNYSELEQMDADLEAMRKSQSAEVADLGLGMSFEDWREVYGVDNAPGFSERWGQF